MTKQRDVEGAVPYGFYPSSVSDHRGGRSEATRAVMNDSPVDCQNHEWTEPQRDPRPPDTISTTPPSVANATDTSPDKGRQDEMGAIQKEKWPVLADRPLVQSSE